MTQLQTRLTNILSRHFLIRPQAIKTRRRFQDLGLSTIEMNEVFNYLENEFEISLDEQETRKISTVGDALAVVERHLVPAYGR